MKKSTGTGVSPLEKKQVFIKAKWYRKGVRLIICRSSLLLKARSETYNRKGRHHATFSFHFQSSSQFCITTFFTSRLFPFLTDIKYNPLAACGAGTGITFN